MNALIWIVTWPATGRQYPATSSDLVGIPKQAVDRASDGMSNELPGGSWKYSRGARQGHDQGPVESISKVHGRAGEARSAPFATSSPTVEIKAITHPFTLPKPGQPGEWRILEM
jgi:hypothetical protein